MDDDGFMLEMCSSKAAWQVVPKDVESIDMKTVGARIVEAVWSLRIETKFCSIFEGSSKLTLYPSGKLMIKSESDEEARDIARKYVKEWVA